MIWCPRDSIYLSDCSLCCDLHLKIIITQSSDGWHQSIVVNAANWRFTCNTRFQSRLYSKIILQFGSWTKEWRIRVLTPKRDRRCAEADGQCLSIFFVTLVRVSIENVFPAASILKWQSEYLACFKERWYIRFIVLQYRKSKGREVIRIYSYNTKRHFNTKTIPLSSRLPATISILKLTGPVT